MLLNFPDTDLCQILIGLLRDLDFSVGRSEARKSASVLDGATIVSAWRSFSAVEDAILRRCEAPWNVHHSLTTGRSGHWLRGFALAIGPLNEGHCGGERSVVEVGHVH